MHNSKTTAVHLNLGQQNSCNSQNTTKLKHYKTTYPKYVYCFILQSVNKNRNKLNRKGLGDNVLKIFKENHTNTLMSNR